MKTREGNSVRKNFNILGFNSNLSCKFQEKRGRTEATNSWWRDANNFKSKWRMNYRRIVEQVYSILHLRMRVVESRSSGGKKMRP